MKVVVLTTSYPRDDDDVTGAFVAAAVRGARGAGIDVTVVSPATFPHFGVAYGSGIPQNLRAQPWKLLLVPAFLAAFARAARRAARDADLVHAHWIPSAFAARATGKPYVLQVWGSDVELARRLPYVVRPLLRGARSIIAPSAFLAGEARMLGARDVRVVPHPVEIPPGIVAPDDPPHVLYAGRLSDEKGVREFVAATSGLRRVILGEGPVHVPDALPFVPPSEVGRWYDRAAVVCVPSRREGYGQVAREAMAHGRPVVASAVGGLADAVSDGETGVLVPPRNVAALRAAIERLLADPAERERLGVAARAQAEEEFAPGVAADRLADVYARMVA